MEVYQVLWRELLRRDLLVLPKVHISPACAHQEQRLREYVRRLQGQLAESPGGAGFDLFGGLIDAVCCAPGRSTTLGVAAYCC
jgi:hypothetical protein